MWMGQLELQDTSVVASVVGPGVVRSARAGGSQGWDPECSRRKEQVPLRMPSCLGPYSVSVPDLIYIDLSRSQECRLVWVSRFVYRLSICQLYYTIRWCWWAIGLKMVFRFQWQRMDARLEGYQRQSRCR